MKLSEMRQHGEHEPGTRPSSRVEGWTESEPLPSCHRTLWLRAGLPTQNLPPRCPSLSPLTLTHGDGGRPGWPLCAGCVLLAVPTAPRLPGGAPASRQSWGQGRVATPPTRRLGDFPGRQLAHRFAFALCLPFRKVFLSFLP